MSQVFNGPIIGPTSYTPSLTAFGTVANTSFFYSQIGKLLTVWGAFDCGTTAASSAMIPLPAGFTIDTTKLSSTANRQVVGHWVRLTNGVAITINTQSSGQGNLFYDGSTSDRVFFCYQSASTQMTKINANDAINNTDGITVQFTIPVV